MDQTSRSEKTAQRINAIMARFPLILDILEELEGASSTSPADEFIRQGALRGVAEMVSALKRLEPAPCGAGDRKTDAVDLATTWMLGQKPGRYLPPETFVILARTVARCLPQDSTQREKS